MDARISTSGIRVGALYLVNTKREIPAKNGSLLNKQRNQYPTRPPLFYDKLYKYWKIRMRDYLMAEDSDVWEVICKGPYVPTM